MRIALGADHAGVALKEDVKRQLAQRGVAFTDFGTDSTESVDYPDYAAKVAHEVASGAYDRGILFCGSGIGMAIAANKVPGVRAAQAHDVYSAQRARKSNDAQVLTMGARVIGPEAAKTIVAAWLESEFDGGGSTRKVAKIADLERRLG